jgi:hypothetical protein
LKYGKKASKEKHKYEKVVVWSRDIQLNVKKSKFASTGVRNLGPTQKRAEGLG